MASFSVTFSNVLLALLYLLPGFFLCKCKKVRPEHLSSVSVILLYVCGPGMFLNALIAPDFSPGLTKKMGLFVLFSFFGEMVLMLLLRLIFRKRKAEVLFVCEDNAEVGFALFFHNFSTFLGRAGLYLEDLFVLPEYRGRGYGKALLRKLGAIAVERGCGRLEWSCLDWNRPSIDFYRSLGAVPMEAWTTYRVSGETLQALARGDAEGK